MQDRELWVVLSNSSDELTGMTLDGFTFEKRKLTEALPTLTALMGLPEWEVMSQLDGQYFCTDESNEHVYLVTGITSTEPEEPGATADAIAARFLEGNAAADRVEVMLMAMRLVTPSPMSSAMTFVWKRDEEGVPHLDSSLTARPRPQVFQPFRFGSWDRGSWERAVMRHLNESHKEFVAIAIDCFEQSFIGHRPAIVLVSVVTALEALLNPGGDRIRFHLSTNVGVLLGKSRNEAEEITRAVKRLYDLRSRVVHSGRQDKVSWQDVQHARHIFSQAAQAVHRMDLEKAILCEDLGQRELGDAPTTNFD